MSNRKVIESLVEEFTTHAARGSLHKATTVLPHIVHKLLDMIEGKAPPMHLSVAGDLSLAAKEFAKLTAADVVKDTNEPTVTEDVVAPKDAESDIEYFKRKLGEGAPVAEEAPAVKPEAEAAPESEEPAAEATEEPAEAPQAEDEGEDTSATKKPTTKARKGK